MLATGLGKTRIAAYIANEWGEIAESFGRPTKVLWLAARDELITQAMGALGEATGEAIGLEKADSTVAGKELFPGRCIVASVQTLSHELRRRRIPAEEIGLVIGDEGHHFVAPHFKELLRHYGASKLLLLSATPNRTDEKPLGEIVQAVPFYYPIIDALHDGWIPEIRQQFVEIDGLDFSKVKEDSKGELSEEQIAAIVMEEKPLHAICCALRDTSEGRKTIAYVPGVDCAVAIADIMNNRYSPGGGWAAVSSRYAHRDTRERDIDAMRAGHLRGLINSDLLCEGVDVPNVDHIFMGRPLKSALRVEQCIGRGTRGGPNCPVSGKTDLLVTDIVGSGSKIKFTQVTDLLGGKYDKAVVEEAKRKLFGASLAGESGSVMSELQAALTQLDELKRRERMKVIAECRLTKRALDPFDLLDIPDRIEPDWWQGKPPTQEQIDILAANKIDHGRLEYREAKRLVEEIQRRRNEGLASPRQARMLRAWGYDTNIRSEEASAIIEKMKGPEAEGCP